MSRTVKYLFTALIISVMLSGCFEGPTGPQGTQGDTGTQGEKGPQGDTGTQGEKGDKGDGIIESWTHTIKASEVEYDYEIGTYIVTLTDKRFEKNCTYQFWEIYNNTVVSMDGVFIDGAYIFLFMISDGVCVFTGYDFTGTTIIIYKIKPSTQPAV